MVDSYVSKVKQLVRVKNRVTETCFQFTQPHTVRNMSGASTLDCVQKVNIFIPLTHGVFRISPNLIELELVVKCHQTHSGASSAWKVGHGGLNGFDGGGSESREQRSTRYVQREYEDRLLSHAHIAKRVSHTGTSLSIVICSNDRPQQTSI